MDDIPIKIKPEFYILAQYSINKAVLNVDIVKQAKLTFKWEQLRQA